MNQVYNLLLKIWNKIPTNLVEKTKNILAIFGIVSIFYFIFFFSIEKPKLIEESEEKVEVLENEIEKNQKEIKVLEKENIKIEKEIVKLEEELDVIQDKSEKYKKQYEKEVSNIRNASDDKLVKLFTNTFQDYQG
jgi:septal ring factor EnvC (AmiA/AmiB activator)